MGSAGASPYPVALRPTEVVEHALEFPFVGIFNQAVPNGVIPNIQPFLRIVFTVTQSVMEFICLPLPVNACGAFGELTFPVSHPAVERKINILWGDETVQMIWHQNLIGDQPFVRLQPDFAQQIVRFITSEPWFSISRAGVEQNKCWFANIDSNTRRRMFTSGFCHHCLSFPFLHSTGRAIPILRDRPD